MDDDGYAEATTEQLQMVLYMIDCLTDWQIDQLVKWTEGGHFFTGNEASLNSMADYARRAGCLQ